jgi:glyoxylase-like metal-dependent hydrolase (beta-lactamase superfamily II)
VPSLYRLPGVTGVNAYVWHPRADQRSFGEPILFDCGWPWSGQGLVASLEALECHVADVRTIAITHDDVDHAGRLAALQAVANAEVVAGELEVTRLAGNAWRWLPGFPGPVDLLGAGIGLLYRQWPHRPVRVTRAVSDGDEIGGGWLAVDTPGHTPGHEAYFHPALKVLIAGDALGHWGGRFPVYTYGKLRFPVAAYSEDVRAAARSVRKLAALEPDVICFGHGTELYGAAEILQRFAESLPSS